MEVRLVGGLRVDLYPRVASLLTAGPVTRRQYGFVGDSSVVCIGQHEFNLDALDWRRRGIGTGDSWNAPSLREDDFAFRLPVIAEICVQLVDVDVFDPDFIQLLYDVLHSLPLGLTARFPVTSTDPLCVLPEPLRGDFLDQCTLSGCPTTFSHSSRLLRDRDSTVSDKLCCLNAQPDDLSESILDAGDLDVFLDRVHPVAVRDPDTDRRNP